MLNPVKFNFTNGIAAKPGALKLARRIPELGTAIKEGSVEACSILGKVDCMLFSERQSYLAQRVLTLLRRFNFKTVRIAAPLTQTTSQISMPQLMKLGDLNSLNLH